MSYETALWPEQEVRVLKTGNRVIKTGSILVVDENPAIQQTIASYLGEKNIPVNCLSDYQEVPRHLRRSNPSAVILDMFIGKYNAIDLVRDIRSKSDVPIIVMTKHLGDQNIDGVVCLELGADALIAKPICLRDLLARVRAIWRRHEMGRLSRTREPERGGYIFAGWHLERRKRRLFDPDGTPVFLTLNDYALLLAFLESPQRPLSRELLLQSTTIHGNILDRSVDVQIFRLRCKIEADKSAPQMIRTERGFGYTFTVPVEPF